MEEKLQTKVTTQNRQEYLNSVYPQLSKSKEELIQLNEYNVSSFVLADCCGWYYKTLWPDLKIIGLESFYSVKEYKLERDKVQGIIDNRDYANIKWPTISVNDCALIFDYSVILKYRTVDDIIKVILSAVNKYQPKVIVFRSFVLFIDDPRIVERFELLSKFLIPGYVITNFMYDTKNLKISYSKKLDI